MDPPPVIVTIRNSKDYIRVLLYSYYTTITGWGVLLIYSTHGHENLSAAGCSREPKERKLRFIEEELQQIPGGRLMPKCMDIRTYVCRYVCMHVCMYLFRV